MTATQQRAVNKKVAVKAFQRMWVAGTLGTLFVVIVRDVLTHVQELWFVTHSGVDWQYSLAQSLQFLYVLWLASYFFIANLGNEHSARHPRAKDVWFDIGQSVGSFVVAYAAGLLIPEHGFTSGAHGDQLLAAAKTVAVANGVIAAICASAWLLFRRDADQRKWANSLRLSGFAVAVVSSGLAWKLSSHGSIGATAVLVAMLVLFLVLSALLGWHGMETVLAGDWSQHLISSDSMADQVCAGTGCRSACVGRCASMCR